MTSERRCWTESGAHFYIRASDGSCQVWVCQVCGHILHADNGYSVKLESDSK